MTWIILPVAIAVVLSVLLGVNRWRSARRLAAELHALSTAVRSPDAIAIEAVLPAVVARYRHLAVGTHAPVHTLRMRHGGTFQTSATASPRAIRGEQWFTSDPPGFVWSAHLRMAPGIWVHARDMIIAGKGQMLVQIDDTITVADAHGPRFDQGDALRLLAEMVWYPTALFDPRTVSWSAIDATHARATLRLDGISVAGVFEFGADGFPTGMTAERLNDRGQLLPWGGRYRDWRTIDGMRVPFRADVAWQTSPPFVYARWQVETVRYDE